MENNAEVEKHQVVSQPLRVDEPTQSSGEAFANIKQRNQEQMDKDESIANSIWINTNPYKDGGIVGDEWNAFSKTWDDTFIGRIADDYKYNKPYDDIVDDEFKKTWGDSAIREVIKANNFKQNTYQRLRQANNEEHKRQLIRWVKKDVARNEYIDRHLDSYSGMLSERVLASVVTGFVDIDLPITALFGGATKGAYAVMNANKANHIRTAMTLGAVGSHAVGAKMAYDASDGALTQSEALVFGMIGASFDGTMVRRIQPKFDTVDAPPEQILLDTPNDTELVMLENATRKIDDEPVIYDIDALPELPKLPQITSHTFKHEELVAYEKNTDDIWAFDPDTGYTNISVEAKLIRKARKADDELEPVASGDATIDDIHEFLLPREGSGSYTQYNKREQAKASRQYGVGSAKYNNRLSQIAYGKYQHMGSTTKAIAKKTGKTVEWLRTPNGQEFAQKYLIEDNIKSMKRHNVEVTPANYYAYHQLGATRAKRMFTGKLTQKDYNILYQQLSRKAQKSSIGSNSLVLKEWKKAYADGSHQAKYSAPKQKRAVDYNIDNIHKRRKQDESITDNLERKKAFKKTDTELSNLKTQRKKLQDEIDADAHIALKEKRIQKDYRTMADDFRTNGIEYSKEIRRALKSGDKETINTYNNIVEELHNQGYISKGEFESYKHKLDGNKFEPPVLRVTKDKDGSYSIDKTSKDGKKKKVAVGALIAVGITGEAMAGDGSDEFGFGTMLLTGALLGVGVLNRASIQKNIGSMIKKTKNLDRTRDARGRLERTLDGLKSSITETLAPLSKDPNKEFTELLKKVLWDAENGDNLTVERNKASIFHGLSGVLHRGNNVAYQEWLKEIGASRISAMASNLMFGEMSKRMQFEIKVMEFIETGKHGDSAAIKKGANNTQEVLSDLRQQMIDGGAKGADEMFDIKNYMPRYFRSEKMVVMFNSLKKESKDSFITQFSSMFVGKDGNVVKARLKAEEYFKMVTEHNDVKQRFTSLDDIEKFINNNNIKHFTADEMANELGISTSQTGRTKARIRIDKSKFNQINVKDADGNNISLGLNDLFVNNAIEATDRLLNSMSGHIAFADAGFNSIDAVKAISNKGNPANARVLNEIIDSLTGTPILNVSSQTVKLMETIGNYTIALKMPYSVLSLTQEAFVTIVKQRGGIWSEMSREFVNIIRKHGESSALVDELTRFIGQGQHKHSASYGAFSHISDGVDNMTSGYGGAINKTSELARDTVLYNLGLVPVSDFLTRINLVDSASYLHDIANGTKTISPQLRKAIGLTPEIELMLNNKLTKVDGKLQKLDIENWNRVDQLEFRKVIDNMMQKRIQQPTIGGTPHWSRDNPAGVAVSQLLKFPLQAFSNHGIYDLKGALIHKDPRAMSAMFAWFTGGYVASMLRADIKGKEVSDDEHLENAMLSMPLIGASESLRRSLTDSPAMVSAMGDMNDAMIQTIGVIAD